MLSSKKPVTSRSCRCSGLGGRTRRIAVYGMTSMSTWHLDAPLRIGLVHNSQSKTSFRRLHNALYLSKVKSWPIVTKTCRSHHRVLSQCWRLCTVGHEPPHNLRQAVVNTAVQLVQRKYNMDHHTTFRYTIFLCLPVQSVDIAWVPAAMLLHGSCMRPVHA